MENNKREKLETEEVFGAKLLYSGTDGESKKYVYLPHLIKLNATLQGNFTPEEDTVTHYNISQASRIPRNRLLSFDVRAPFKCLFGDVVSLQRVFDFLTVEGYDFKWLSDRDISSRHIAQTIRGYPKSAVFPPNLDALMFLIVANRMISHPHVLQDLAALDPEKPLTGYYTIKTADHADREQLRIVFNTDYRKRYIAILRIIKALYHLGKFHTSIIETIAKGLKGVPALHYFSGVANINHEVFDNCREEVLKLNAEYKKVQEDRNRQAKRKVFNPLLSTNE